MDRTSPAIVLIRTGEIRMPPRDSGFPRSLVCAECSVFP